MVGNFQIFPVFSQAKRSELKESLRVQGLLVALEVDQFGTILDGHHRWAAIEELRAEGHRVRNFEVNVRNCANDDERLAIVVALNERRRHLTARERKEVGAELRRRDWSFQRIADELNAKKSTIARDLRGVPTGTPGTTVGKDGKRYPARQRAVVRVTSATDQQRAQELMVALGDDLPDKSTSLKSLEKRVKRRRLTPSGPPDHRRHRGTKWSVVCEDLREWKLKPHSVDCIVTDPPWNRAGIALFGDLSRFAHRVLKPSGLLVVYMGDLYFEQTFDLLRVEMKFVSMMAILQNSVETHIYPIKMNIEHRPLVVLSNGNYQPEWWMHSAFVSSTPPEKDLHEWQQSVPPCREIIETISRPGDVICDPFTCTGTTGEAALLAGRSFIGGEIDPQMVDIAVRRLTTVQKHLAAK